jgi:hypothetical protein
MIDLYFWPTPNGKKISIMLEETKIPYRLVPVNIGRGEQFRPEFLAISPNNRMPSSTRSRRTAGPQFRSSSQEPSSSIWQTRPVSSSPKTCAGGHKSSNG